VIDQKKLSTITAPIIQNISRYDETGTPGHMTLLRYERIGGVTYAHIGAHHSTLMISADRPYLLEDWRFLAFPSGIMREITGVTASMPDPSLPYEILLVPLGTNSVGILSWQPSILAHFDDFSVTHNPSAQYIGYSLDCAHAGHSHDWSYVAYIIFAIILILLGIATIERGRKARVT